MKEKELFEELKKVLFRDVNLNMEMFYSALNNCYEDFPDDYDQQDLKKVKAFIKTYYVEPVKGQAVSKDTTPQAEVKLKNLTISSEELDEADEWKVRNVLILSQLEDTVKECRPLVSNKLPATSEVTLKKEEVKKLKHLSITLADWCNWTPREAAIYICFNKIPTLRPIVINIDGNNYRLGHPGKITMQIDPRVKGDEVRHAYNSAVKKLGEWLPVSRKPSEKSTR